MRELAAIAFGVVAVFLVCSVLSEKYSHAVQGSSNIMGPVGHLVGVMLIGFMGWCALLPAVWGAGVAVVFWRRGAVRGETLAPIEKKGVRLLGVAGSCAAACIALSVYGGREAGGAIGFASAELLTRYVGAAGAAMAALALLLVALALATQRNALQIVVAAGSALLALSRFGAAALVRSASFAGENAQRAAGAWASRARERAERASPVEAPDDERPFEFDVPSPKRRRAAMPGGAPQAEAPAEPKLEVRRDEVVVKRQRRALGVGERPREKASKRDKADKERKGLLRYEPPPLSLLKRGEPPTDAEDDAELVAKSRMIEAKLADFGISGRVTEVHPGPVITLFEFEPAAGVKVGRIAALQDDLAMTLRASSIRIIAPIPRKGTVGIEVPNRQRDLVRLRDVLESEGFAGSDSILNVPIGKDTYGDPVVADIATMPHLLMAGTTGTGKSVCINSLLVSFLYRASPADLGLILIDPKILELSVYEGIPHLMVPVVTVPKQARAVLEWAVKEMDRRYRLMQRFGVRSLDGYNRIARGEVESERKEPRAGENVVMLREEQMIEEGTIERPAAGEGGGAGDQPIPLPKVVIVIDELADLMLSVGREIEDLICRLAQKARAAGIHLIVATQRPSVDVITGLIKANFPARISFRVSSRIDARTILDSGGSERLLGRGDMLIRLPGWEHVRRVHGAFVSDQEVQEVVKAVSVGDGPHYDAEILELCKKALEDDKPAGSSDDEADEDYDVFYDRAVQLVIEKGQASTSMIQRAFRIGYNRAARIIEVMEREGVVGPSDGVKGRDVLITSMDRQAMPREDHGDDDDDEYDPPDEPDPDDDEDDDRF